MQVPKSESGLVVDERADAMTQKKIRLLERIKAVGKRLAADWKFERDEANAR